MQKLSETFLNTCRRDEGFIIRGENMTRVETFVDAAFAFAITMLVISLDAIPRSVAELFVAAKDIPAFFLSGLMIGFIWLRHSQWSRRFGMQDSLTIFLSLCLVMLVLVFIYPLKLVFMGMFSWMSDGYLSSGIKSMKLYELANLFVFFAVGFLCLSLIFFLFYKNTLKHAEELALTEYERYFCKTELIGWVILALTAITSAVLAKTLPGMWVIASGFTYSTLMVSQSLWYHHREKNKPAQE